MFRVTREDLLTYFSRSTWGRPEAAQTSCELVRAQLRTGRWDGGSWSPCVWWMVGSRCLTLPVSREASIGSTINLPGNWDRICATSRWNGLLTRARLSMMSWWVCLWDWDASGGSSSRRTSLTEVDSSHSATASCALGNKTEGIGWRAVTGSGAICGHWILTLEDGLQSPTSHPKPRSPNCIIKSHHLILFDPSSGISTVLGSIHVSFITRVGIYLHNHGSRLFAVPCMAQGLVWGFVPEEHLVPWSLLFRISFLPLPFTHYLLLHTWTPVEPLSL